MNYRHKMVTFEQVDVTTDIEMEADDVLETLVQETSEEYVLDGMMGHYPDETKEFIEKHSEGKKPSEDELEELAESDLCSDAKMRMAANAVNRNVMLNFLIDCDEEVGDSETLNAMVSILKEKYSPSELFTLMGFEFKFRVGFKK